MFRQLTEAALLKWSNEPVNNWRRKNPFDNPDTPFLFPGEIIPYREISKDCINNKKRKQDNFTGCDCVHIRDQ